MLAFLLLLIGCATPVCLLMWWKRFYAGLLIGQALFTVMVSWYWTQAWAGPVGWINNYYLGYLTNYPKYSVRWMYPTFIHFACTWLHISHEWILIWFIEGALWWLGLCLFYRYLREFFTPFIATIGAVLPLLTFGAAYAIGWNMDSINFIIVITCFWALHRYLEYREHYWLPLIGVGGLAALLLEFPVPPHTTLNTHHIIMGVVSVGVWGVFAVHELRAKLAVPFIKRSLMLTPIYVIVAAVAVDWFRWWVLAAPIWVPLVLLSFHQFIHDHPGPRSNPFQVRVPCPKCGGSLDYYPHSGLFICRNCAYEHREVTP